MRIKTCLNRKLGRCNPEKCEIDYKPITPEHPYNNLTCPNYVESTIFLINVLERKEGENALGRKISS